MYERSAIILEKYYNNMFGFDKKENLKTVYKDFKYTIEEIQKYQDIVKEEDNIINEFDITANEIRQIQQEQKKIYKSNIKLEEDRNQLFDILDEDPSAIEKKLLKIEEKINENNKNLEELRERFVKNLVDFEDKQTERNKISRSRREEEKEYLQIIQKSTNDISNISKEIIMNIKKFINFIGEDFNNEIIETMIENGKDERIPFDKNVIEKAVRARNEIAKREAACYVTVFDKLRKVLSEINNDDIKIDKYVKILRDVGAKFAFLKAQKMYIVAFLDNERMTAINGAKVHENLMSEACEQFENDMDRFDNLYELVVKEITGKATKKAYKELYDVEYLNEINKKEENLEKELNNLKMNSGVIINSDSWRIEEIKNIYNVFENEVTQKFERDLSEFKPEQDEEDIADVKSEISEKIQDSIFKRNKYDDDIFGDDYDDDDDYDDEYDEDSDYEETEEHEDTDDFEDDDEYVDSDYEDDDEYDDYDNEYEDNDEYDEEEVDDDDKEEDNDYEDDDDYEDSDFEDEEYEDDDYEDDEEYEEDDEFDEDDDDYEEEEEFDEDDDEDYDDEEDNDNKESKNNNNTKASSVKNSKENKKGKGLFNKFFRDK